MKNKTVTIESQWSAEMINSFKDKFPFAFDKDLAVVFGINRRTVSRMGKRLGLEKDPSFLKESRAILGKRACANRDPEKHRTNTIRALKDLWHKERLRVKWGLPQKTNVKIGRTSRAVVFARYYLRTRGYIVPKGGRDAYIILGHTNRSFELEQEYASKHRIEFEEIAV